MTNRLAELISVAKEETPADLILANARIVNVFNGEIETGNVAIYRDKIAGIGKYKQAKKTVDLDGKYLAPGLINGHTHLESSMLDVGQYARAVVPHGTSALITDLHEIGNVKGIEGLKYILGFARRLPFELFLMAPSCVPATNMETSGSELGAADIRKILKLKNCIGLGEVMNYPGVLFADAAVLKKIESAGSEAVDGHAPGVSGNNLNAYIAAGIHSDHESVTLAEAKEKLQKGMWVMIREGSTEKNLEELLPIVTDKTYKRCMFVVDDRNCVDLLHDGDIDAVVRKAIRLGLEPVRAVQMATINTAEYFRLPQIGAVAPGYLANLIVVEDLARFTISTVYYHGQEVARDGKPLFELPRVQNKNLINTINFKPLTTVDLKIKANAETRPVIEVVPGQIITRKKLENPMVVNGEIKADISRDLLKLAVVERHRKTGNIGLGLVKGLGLKEGALASSVAHDSHNIVVAGTNDEDMLAAVKEIERLQGGLVVASQGEILGSLALPVAGLLSVDPLEKIVAKLGELEKIARDLGVTVHSPFSILSFIALAVIPEIRLSDRGLVDVVAFKLIE